MVLEHLMTPLALWVCLIVALPTAACQAPAREPSLPASRGDEQATAPTAAAHAVADPQEHVPVAEQAEVAGVSLTLRGCQLSMQTAAGAEVQTIDLPESCKFGRNPDGSVQIVKTQQGATVLVVSSRPSADRAGDCDTRKRALVVDRGRVKISSKEKKSAGCGPIGPFDEPIFIVLAASVESAGP